MSADASLYYDVQTVATLAQDGNVLQQASDVENGIAGGNLYAAAPLWSNFSLQTDHYAVAYFVAGGLYENPYYFQGGSCNDGGSDCTYWPTGGAYYIASALIYLGSTVADQTAVPLDGLLNPLDLDINSSIRQRTPPAGGWFQFVNVWSQRLAAAWAATLIAQGHDTSISLPFILQVVGDCEYGSSGTAAAARFRFYKLLDGQGRPWSDQIPIVVHEIVTTTSATTEISANGTWCNATARRNGTCQEEELTRSVFRDDLSLTTTLALPTSGLQQFYATDFPNRSVSYPSISGLKSGSVPLLILDSLSRTRREYSEPSITNIGQAMYR